MPKIAKKASKMGKTKKKLSPFFQEVAISHKRIMVKSWNLAQINRKIDNNMGFFSKLRPKSNKFQCKCEKRYCKEIEIFDKEKGYAKKSNNSVE